MKSRTPHTDHLLDALFDTPACGYCLVDPDDVVMRVNDEWLRSTGFERASVLGRDIVALFPGTEDLSRAMHALARRGQQVHVPKHAQLLSGRETWWDGWISPVPFDEGIGLLIAARESKDGDATDAPVMRAIFGAIDDVIYAKDSQGRLVYANPATLALLGKPVHEVIGRTDFELLGDPHVAREVMRNDRLVMESGKALELEEAVPLPDGTQRVWLSRKVAWRHVDGRVIGLLGISRDITQRVHADKELRQLRALMQSTLDNFPTAITFKDLEGRFIEVNRAVQQMFGRPREALLGLAPHDFLAKEQADAIRAHEDVVVRTGRPLQIEHVRDLEGRRTVFLDTVFPLTDDTGQVWGVGYISHDVTRQKTVEQELSTANGQLLEAARQKDQFIATLGHELRNPLAPIRTAAELIRASRPADASVQRAQQIITRQSEHLTRIVNDLLDVSRVTFGNVELQLEPVDLGGLAVGAAEAMQPQFDAAGIRLELRLSSNPRVHGDATRLSQCISNLLANALKFTPSGGMVQLRVRREGENAVVEVQDSGVGIEPANLAVIFDLFVQEHRSGLHGNRGLGIGLALTRKLVALHGGNVEADSRGPGTGSLFTLRLPLLATQSRPETSTGGPQPAALPAAAARVLVVDDNEDAAQTLSELLAICGFECEVAHSGEAALATAAARAPRAVLLDIGLPGIDGYEVCRRLRASQVSQPVVIALTGWGQDTDRARARGAGFDEHLTKPVELDRLLEVLSRLLRNGSAGDGATGHPHG